MPKPTEFHDAFARALRDVSPHAVTLDVCDSTMDEARALATSGAPHGTVVVANEQRAGRGRLDRAWVSPPGEGLHATWIVRPALRVERWTLLPLFAGVAAAEAIRARTGVDAVLKWPNDVMVGARKLGGILVEADVPRCALVGLGVNVAHASFPAELPDATSLAIEGARRLDRADLLAQTMLGFDGALRDPDAALERYRALCATLGARVRVERPTGNLEGAALGIDPSGALILSVAGEDVTVQAGDVVHLRQPS